jgi:zinc protease
VDSTAFLAYQSQALETLLNRPASPDLAFQDTLRSVLSQGHPRARPISTQVFENLDLERSFEIYRERFADASDFTFYLVGSFDPDSIRPLVEQYLASLPGIGRVERARDLGIRPPSGVVHRTVRRGLEPRASTQLVFTGPFDFQRANVLAIQSLADVLRIRLREALREDLGGTYGVTVRGSASRDPVPQYQFAIGFSADPARLDEVVQALFAEIEKMKADGPTQPDLAKVVETQFRSRETQLRENSFWATQFLIYDQYGWDIGEIPATSTRSQALDEDTMRAAARRYLDTFNYVRVTLLPER